MRSLPLAVLVGIGAFALHELRYVVVYRHEAGEVLQLREHAYLPLVTPVVAALLVLGVRNLVLRRPGAPPFARVWAAVSTIMLAVYAVQELAEGVLSPDHPAGLHALVGHAGWTALVLALVMGLLVALALRGVDAAAGSIVVVAPRLALPRPAMVATLALPRARRPRDAVAHFMAGRGPPVLRLTFPQEPQPRHTTEEIQDMKVQRITRRGAIVAVAAGALVAPAGAAAHVTVQPQSGVTAGGFARIDVRVPNERDNASTDNVVVDVPPGFYNLNYEPVPGWTIKINKEKLAKPVEQFGEQVTEQVKDVSFTADSKKDAIQPGQFQQFGLSGGPVPGKAGQKLSFPAIQTYSNGEVVRWIDKDPEAETPASTLLLLPEEGQAAPTQPVQNKDTATNVASKEDVDDKASKGLGIAALIIGALGLVIGIAAFAASRRKPAA